MEGVLDGATEHEDKVLDSILEGKLEGENLEFAKLEDEKSEFVELFLEETRTTNLDLTKQQRKGWVERELSCVVNGLLQKAEKVEKFEAKILEFAELF